MHSPGLDDSELLRRARVDANAFAASYRRHARAVYRTLVSGCGDPDVALDLTAETSARALQSIGASAGRASPPAVPGSSRSRTRSCSSTNASGEPRIARDGGSGSSRRRGSPAPASPQSTGASASASPGERADVSRSRGSRARPRVDVLTDRALRVYGLAMDGVTAISLRARGTARPAVVARNAFYLQANSLGGRKGFAGTLIVRYRDGSTHQVPLRIGGYERRTQNCVNDCPASCR
jgi:hypothetical protein